MTADTRTTDQIIAAANERARRAERRERWVSSLVYACAIGFGFQLSWWFVNTRYAPTEILPPTGLVAAMGITALPWLYVRALFWWFGRRADRKDES